MQIAWIVTPQKGTSRLPPPNIKRATCLGVLGGEALQMPNLGISNLQTSATSFTGKETEGVRESVRRQKREKGSYASIENRHATVRWLKQSETNIELLSITSSSSLVTAVRLTLVTDPLDLFLLSPTQIFTSRGDMKWAVIQMTNNGLRKESAQQHSFLSLIILFRRVKHFKKSAGQTSF